LHPEQEAIWRGVLGDVVNEQAGQIWFLLAHVAWFGIWIGLNIRILQPDQRFDPFPFSLLTLVVSLEAIFLSLFILISQNRSMRHAEQRSHLDLQVHLLPEAEIGYPWSMRCAKPKVCRKVRTLNWRSWSVKRGQKP
jgi:uncharacterized membrane protein